jgi:uncharacterized protein (UPF0335 family)
MRKSMNNNQIAAVVQRIEKLEDEKSQIAIDISEIYKEAKGNGFDTKILKKVVALRKKSQSQRDEEQAILDLYMAAVEGFDTTPLGKAAKDEEEFA